MPDYSKLNVGAFDDFAWESRGSSNTATVTRHDKSMYRLKRDKPVQVRFIGDPVDMSAPDELCMRSTPDGSWVKYREAVAEVDQITRNNPDGRITHRFIPVADYEVTSSGVRKDRKDPVHRALKASDKELSDERWGRPYPKVADKMLVPVIYIDGSFGDPKYDPEPGAVIILVFGPRQVKALAREYEAGMRHNNAFTLSHGVWTLLWDGTTEWELHLSFDNNVAPLSNVPQPIDARATLRAIRAETEQELFGLDKALAALEDIADVEAVAAFEEVASVEDVAADEDVPEWDRPEAKQHLQPKVAAKAANGDNPFKRRSPAWVKGMLKKHKVDFDPGTPNDVLYEIAYESLPHDIAA
jgi:hypothetical protein